MVGHDEINDSIYSLQETMRHYRMPTLVMCLGVLLSIGGFLMILQNNLDSLKKDFHSYANLEISSLKYSFNGYRRGMELVQKFFESSDSVEEEEFNHFVNPLLERTNFQSLWWVPYIDGKDYKIVYSAGTKGSSVNGDIISASNYEEIFKSLEDSSTRRLTRISAPFSISAPDNKKYISFIYPHIKSGKLQGFIIGILDLSEVFSKEVSWIKNTGDASVYIFDVAGDGTKTPIYVSEVDGAGFAEIDADYASLTMYKAFFHSEIMEMPLSRWELLFVPTDGYVAQASSRLAWVILIFGVLLTAMVSLFLFSLIGRGMQIKKRVKEQTAALRELTQSLAESEKKSRAIVDNTVDGIITIDSEGCIETYNYACEQIFGYATDEVLGRNVKMLMPEPYHGEHDGYLSRYKKTGEAKIIGIGREVEGKRKDGSIFPIDLSVSRVNLDGRTIYSGIVRDITERKALMKHMEIMVEELGRSNAELERFAYVASHDLQEPLRMVRNFTKLLEKKYKNKLDDQAAEYIRFSSEAAEHMQAMVEDLLEYARLGTEAEKNEDIDCAKALEYVRANLREGIEKAKAKITNDNLPVVTGNPVRFTRLLQNLVGNAIKYHKPDLSPKIHIGVEEMPAEWVFSVKDNGLGMRQEYCKKIFDPFERLHNKEEYAGTGIGLSICKKIVESFGGRIWAESKEGKGSVFYFTLPKLVSNQEERSAA